MSPWWQQPDVTQNFAGKTDDEVVQLSIRNPEVFAALFDRHHKAVHAYAVSRVGRDGADDVLADVFLAAFSQRDRYDCSQISARPWLYGIAANVLRRRWRSGAAFDRLTRAAAANTPSQVDSHDDLVARHMDSSQEWTAVRAVLDGIDPGDREALLLYAWEELTYVQIAAAMGIPVGTVRSRIHRARAQLNNSLNKPDIKESRS